MNSPVFSSLFSCEIICFHFVLQLIHCFYIFYNNKKIKYNKQAAASNSSTGISPYLILMRIPHNAVRAFNAGVSLFCIRGHGRQVTNLLSDIIIFARYKRSWRICHSARSDANVPICCLYCIFSFLFQRSIGFSPISAIKIN